MAERFPMPRAGHVTLCDMVRREDNGKELYIGVYAATIVVPVLPFIAPTLAFVMSVTGEADDRPKKLAFAVELSPTEKLEFEVPIGELAAASKETVDGDKVGYYRAAVTFQMADVVLSQAGPLNCFMIDEHGSHLIARYRISEKAPPGVPEATLAQMRATMKQRIEMIKAMNAISGQGVGEASVSA